MLLSSAVRLLSKIPLLEGISSCDIETLAANAYLKCYPPAGTVLRYGEKTSAIYIVVDGTLKVVLPTPKNDLTEVNLINLVGPKDFLGEVHALDGKGHSASIIAAENVSLLCIQHNALFQVMTNSPLLTKRMEALVTQRLREMTERQVWMANAKVEERVGRFLLCLARRYKDSNHIKSGTCEYDSDQSSTAKCFVKQKKMDAMPKAAIPAYATGKAENDSLSTMSKLSVPLPLRLPQGDLANLVGACRYRTGRAMRELDEMDLISRQPNYRILVLDYNRLAGWCNDYG